MSANVESMFYVREMPWHGLGTKVVEAPNSKYALIAAGLNWKVLQEPIYTEENEMIRDYKANVRDCDRKVLGAVRIALTPIRVVCNNTLNLALSTAKRSWSMIHTGDIKSKMKEAKETLFLAEQYMDELGKEFENLRMKRVSEQQVMDYIEVLLPVEHGSTPQQIRNMKCLREDMKARYFDAPDLKDLGNNAYRFINAVSDFATHAEPLRRTANYKENMFAKTVEGNPMIDKAYQMVCAA